MQRIFILGPFDFIFIKMNLFALIGSLTRINHPKLYGLTHLLSLFLFALKGSKCVFLYLSLQLVVCRVAAVKGLPVPSIVQIIFYFRSFEIIEGILRNRK